MDQAQERPSFRLSLICLLCLGSFFYVSYGFSNWLASRRADVPSIVFEWERYIPFIRWTIVPYWTTNIFYAASFFLCRSKIEFRSHVCRLLTAQLISIFCFIAFPLQFSLPKPDTAGSFGFFYDALALFDKPFNQAPSLHIALTVILGALYLKILPKAAGVFFAFWSLLVMTSVLTTYQHHFIDVPTGLLLGLFCLWLWPADGSKHDIQLPVVCGRRLMLAGAYTTAAALITIAGFSLQGAFLWMLWPAGSLAAVGAGYLILGTSIFGKTSSGALGWPSRIFLFPYLQAARLNALLWTRGDPEAVEILDGVYLGSFPSGVTAAKFATVVDLTGEFHAPQTSAEWISMPLLDLVAPQPRELVATALEIEKSRKRGHSLSFARLGTGGALQLLQSGLCAPGT